MESGGGTPDVEQDQKGSTYTLRAREKIVAPARRTEPIKETTTKRLKPSSRQHNSDAKKQRPSGLTVDELEVACAIACGLDDLQPEEEELALLPSSTDHGAYVKVICGDMQLHSMQLAGLSEFAHLHQVRNHILTRWRADIRRYLSLEEAGTRWGDLQSTGDQCKQQAP